MMNRQQRRMAVKQGAKSGRARLSSPSEFDVAAHHFQHGRTLQAEAACRAILAGGTVDADGLHRLGMVAHYFKRHEIASNLIARAISLKPGNVAAYSSLAEVLRDMGKLDESAQVCRQAIAIRPDFAEGYNALGRVLHQRRLLPEAVEAYRQAIAADPGFAQAHYNLGSLYIEQGHVEAACAALREAIRNKPDLVVAHRRLAHVLRQNGQKDEAIACLKRALSQNPNESSYYSDLAIILTEQGRALEAIDASKKGLARKSDDAAALTNLGNALHSLGRSDEAIEAYRLAGRLDPNSSTIHSNLGTVYRLKGRVRESIEAFRRALVLDPNCLTSLSGLCQQRRAICDWDGLAGDEAAVLEICRNDRGDDPPPPFFFFAMPASTKVDLLNRARAWGLRHLAPEHHRFRHHDRTSRVRDGRRIRIGYLSADFHTHATGFLIAELLEKHDRSRFEIVAYSNGRNDGSALRQRLVNAFDQFVEIRAASHIEVAQKIFDDEIDILVDLKGYTQDARTEVLALRPAPIQVNYLGYPGTMGADFVDYIIGDPVVTPMDDQPYYSEKIVQLPHCYQPNDTKRRISDQAPTRADCSLPEGAFVFCCFNNSYKLTAAMFDIWMRLLHSVSNSVLWLLEPNDGVKANLHREAAARGIDPDRLVFARKLPLPEHLARHSHADLFLDTLPVNAHTTASDALWSGLPVVTCLGDTFPGRVATSLLRAVGLPELVTFSLQDYEELALRLATNPALLTNVRQKLTHNRLVTPLFDIESYTRSLEQAYIRMVETWEAGGVPEAFAVADLRQSHPS